MPDEAIEQSVVNAKLAGQSQDTVRKAVADKLVAKGVKQDVADDTAKEAVLDAQRSVSSAASTASTSAMKGKPPEFARRRKERLNADNRRSAPSSDLNHKAPIGNLGQADGIDIKRSRGHR